MLRNFQTASCIEVQVDVCLYGGQQFSDSKIGFLYYLKEPKVSDSENIKLYTNAQMLGGGGI